MTEKQARLRSYRVKFRGYEGSFVVTALTPAKARIAAAKALILQNKDNPRMIGWHDPMSISWYRTEFCRLEPVEGTLL